MLKTFVTCQINYCSLVWICHSRTLNNIIKIIHHKALRIVYQDKKANFEELLQKDICFCPFEEFTVFSYRDLRAEAVETNSR